MPFMHIYLLKPFKMPFFVGQKGLNTAISYDSNWYMQKDKNHSWRTWLNHAGQRWLSASTFFRKYWKSCSISLSFFTFAHLEAARQHCLKLSSLVTRTDFAFLVRDLLSALIGSRARAKLTQSGKSEELNIDTGKVTTKSYFSFSIICHW